MTDNSTTFTINRDLLATCWTWAGNTGPAWEDESSPHGIEERVAAVSEAGWQGVGIVHADIDKIRNTIGLDGLKQLLHGSGISIVELEFISNWWMTGELRRESDRVRHELFEAAAALGSTTIKVGSELSSFGATGSVAFEDFAKAFGDLAADAGTHGVRVALEPMPMSNITTVEIGADLVRQADNPNGGLVIDTWHVARAGTPYSDLPKILPMDHVFVVELDDADEAVRGSLWEDTVNERRLPGDGALDTAEFVRIMHEAGWRGHWGVEIISDEHRAKPLKDAVAEARIKTLKSIDVAETRLSR